MNIIPRYETGASLLPLAKLADIAKNAKKSVIGRLFSRRSTAEIYPVGSMHWTALQCAKAENPVVKDLADVQPWFYYDRLTAAAGAAVAQNLQFFTSPQSATKTKLDTNLVKPGELGTAKSFLLCELRFVFSSMFVRDIENMIAGYYNEFWIGDKIYAEGHFDLYPGGAGIAGAIAGTTTASNFVGMYTNGVPDARATTNWGLDSAIHIGQTENFVMKSMAPSAVTMAADGTDVGGLEPAGRGLNLRCVMGGILYRPVS